MSVISATHTVVNTSPVGRRFGAGLLRFVPFAVTAPGFTEPSDADRAIVGQMFAEGDDSDAIADLESRALEAAYHESIEHLQPVVAGICLSCGEYAEGLEWGLCENCLDDAAIDAAIACQNRRAMGQFRVF